MDKATKMSQAIIYKTQNTKLFVFDMIVKYLIDYVKIIIYCYSINISSLSKIIFLN